MTDFFVEGAAYDVIVPGPHGMQSIGGGKLVETYFNVDAEESDGSVVAIVVEKQLAAGAYRAFVPIGPGVIVKKVDAEPVKSLSDRFRVPDNPTVLVLPAAGESEFDLDPQPVAWTVPKHGPARAVVLAHLHAVDPDHASGADVMHEHVMVAFEDPANPMHTHDAAHGTTAIYGEVSLRQSAAKRGLADANPRQEATS